MTPTEAAALLTVCAAFDNRKPDEDAAKAWGMALDDLPFHDCRDAIVAHYRASREWIMPADVRSAVRKVRNKRIADAESQLTPPPHAREGAALHAWLRDARRQLGDGVPIEDVNPPALDAKPRHLPDLRALMPTTTRTPNEEPAA